MLELLNKLAEAGYRDDEGKLLTDDRDFHKLCQLAKEKDKKED